MALTIKQNNAGAASILLNGSEKMTVNSSGAVTFPNIISGAKTGNYLATTNDVLGLVGNMASTNTITASSTLSTADHGVLNAISGSGITITLPLANTFPAGSCINLKMASANTSIINRQGSDVISIGHGNLSLTTITMASGDIAKFISDGSGTWHVAFGSYQENAMRFTSSLATSGYIREPNGVITCWGTATANASGNGTATFATTFSAAPIVVFCQLNTTTSNSGKFITSTSTSGFAWTGVASRAVNFVATGY
jgi:hypothetical protein